MGFAKVKPFPYFSLEEYLKSNAKPKNAAN